MPDQLLKEYLGVPITVSEDGKFHAKFEGRSFSRKNLAEIEKAVRESRTQVAKPMLATEIGYYDDVRHHEIVGWDAKVKRFVVLRYNQRTTISRNTALLRPDAEKEARIEAINAEIAALSRERAKIREQMVRLTLEDLALEAAEQES